MSRPKAQLRLGAFFNPTGHHVASWRHPNAQADAGINFKHYVEIAQTAERAKFDMIFLADNIGVREAHIDALSRSASSVFGVLKRTAEAGSREILLIEAQDELVNPTAAFRAEQL